MSILKVARMGHPVLRQRTKPLDKSDLRNPAVQKFMDDMIDTMYEYHGVGLAAPQVHESLAIFVAMLDEDPTEKSEATVFVNPVIVPAGEATEEGWEGCLSIPDIRGMVPRHVAITLKALDRQGKAVELPLKSFPARVAQHEADHLNGVLFFDRMTSMQSLTFLDEYSRYHAKDGD
jgi:peptide deformylase